MSKNLFQAEFILDGHGKTRAVRFPDDYRGTMARTIGEGIRLAGLQGVKTSSPRKSFRWLNSIRKSPNPTAELEGHIRDAVRRTRIRLGELKLSPRFVTICQPDGSYSYAKVYEIEELIKEANGAIDVQLIALKPDSLLIPKDAVLASVA